MTENSPDIDVLREMHKLFLEALRHREQEILRFLAILGPALAGFGLILYRGIDQLPEFSFGTVFVIGLLLLGAVYSLALSYNYRYIVLQLAKMERVLNIKDVMLVGWPRSPEVFLSRSKIFGFLPWCMPPEIIKVFFGAFIFAIVLVTVIACKLTDNFHGLILWCGSISFALVIYFSIYFGFKFTDKCEKELGQW